MGKPDVLQRMWERGGELERLAGLRDVERLGASAVQLLAEATLHEVDLLTLRERLAAVDVDRHRLEREGGVLRETLAQSQSELAVRTRERDAYKRAKEENDDRFLRERDDARERAEKAERTVQELLVVSKRVGDDHAEDVTRLTAERDAARLQGVLLRVRVELLEAQAGAATPSVDPTPGVGFPSGPLPPGEECDPFVEWYFCNLPSSGTVGEFPHALVPGTSAAQAAAIFAQWTKPRQADGDTPCVGATVLGGRKTKYFHVEMGRGAEGVRVTTRGADGVTSWVFRADHAALTPYRTLIVEGDGSQLDKSCSRWTVLAKTPMQAIRATLSAERESTLATRDATIFAEDRPFRGRRFRASVDRTGFVTPTLSPVKEAPADSPMWSE